MADPFPKSRQLARGERRYRRKVASPKQWLAIREEKMQEGCRIGWSKAHRDSLTIHLHHLVPRSQGGDDIAANLIPLCPECHRRVTENDRQALAMVAASLQDAERAYIVGKLGEGALERLFGV